MPDNTDAAVDAAIESTNITRQATDLKLVNNDADSHLHNSVLKYMKLLNLFSKHYLQRFG